MTIHSNQGILTEMSDIVIDYLIENGLYLKDDSFLAQTLAEIQSSERREWLKTYLSENAYFLLHGIVDLVYSLDFSPSQRNRAIVSISGRVLLRTILEYSGKLTYLADPEISPNQRIKRALKTYYTDLDEYERLLPELKAEPSQNLKEFAREWFAEVGEGKELKRYRGPRSIFDSIGDPEFEEWPIDRTGKSVNPVYALGYQVNSTVTHGNLWAIKHYGLTHVNKPGEVTTALPGLDADGILSLQKAAATVLQLSFGIAVQFMHGHLPSGVMNRLRDHIVSLTNP